MRKLCLLLTLIFLFGCSVSKEPSTLDPGSDQTLRENLNQIVDQQLSREHFSFSIILEDHEYRFVGEQKGTDWTLRSEGAEEPIKVKKRGDKIELIQREKKEKLSERQFGLLSPRDHLILLQESAGRVKGFPVRDQGVQGMEIILDREKIGQIVKQQMGDQKTAQEIANRASRNIQVRYQLWYRTGDKELTRMEIHLDSVNPYPETQIRYIFRNP